MPAGEDDEVDSAIENEFVDGPQAFVKFFGESENRAPASLPVADEIDRPPDRTGR